MAEYNRFVSYMYAYENNKKTVNNGFVRVETRDKESSVYVNMKEPLRQQYEIQSLYGQESSARS